MKRFKVSCRVSVPHWHPGPNDDVSGYTKKRDLVQKDHWVSHEKKAIPDVGEFPVVMPPRDTSYAEVTVTWWKKNRKGEPIVFSGPVHVKPRHFHCSQATADKWGIKDRDIVWIEKTDGPRPGLLKNVLVRVDEWSVDEVHLDTDEANALLVNDLDEVDLIIPPASGE